MDYLAQQFIATRHKLGKILDALVVDIGDIKKNVGAIRDQTERQEKQDKANDGPPPPPIIVNVAPELREPEGVEGNRKTRDDRAHGQQVLLTWGTWLTFIAAAIYALVAYNQFDQMTAQTALLNEQAQHSVIESIGNSARVERQLKIAGEQIAFAKQQMQIDQRAWVGVARVINQGGETNQKVMLTIRNSGRTPALKLSGKCCVMLSRPDTDPIPDFDQEIKADTDRREAQIKKRQEHYRELITQHPAMANTINSWRKAEEASDSKRRNLFPEEGGVLPPDVPQDIPILSGGISWNIDPPSPTNPQWVTYILGKFTYRDIFEGTKPHTTKFCLRHLAGSKEPFSMCPANNWMD